MCSQGLAAETPLPGVFWPFPWPSCWRFQAWGLQAFRELRQQKEERDLDNIPAAYWWNLADAGNGSYYLRSGKGSTIAYTAGGSNNELTAVLANQATGARFTHSQNADGSYSLRTPYKYLGVERTFIFYLTSDNGIGFKQDESETPSQPEEPGTEETEEPETVPPVEEETTAPVENESAVPTEPSQTAPATTVVPGTTTPSLPDTGDHSHIGLYIGLLGFAAVGSGLLLGQSKNRSKEE